jgi:hypothetical protein
MRLSGEKFAAICQLTAELTKLHIENRPGSIFDQIQHPSDIDSIAAQTLDKLIRQAAQTLDSLPRPTILEMLAHLMCGKRQGS